jgi:uncharacterized protein (DUF1786 family)
MSKSLMLDIGAGTMDILYYDETSGLCYKAVVKSPVLYLAEKAKGLEGDLLITGCEMGGGAISEVLKQRAKEAKVVMSVSAAATIHYNVEKVRSWGIKVVEDKEADELCKAKEYNHYTAGDLEMERLKNIVNGFGVPFAFDVAGICAQDHGVPPADVSHLDYRHNTFKKSLDENRFPHALLYETDSVPSAFNRLMSIVERARIFPAEEVHVMDSGMAVILGASMDVQARSKERVLVLDVATLRTLGASLEGDEICGFFEYHTHDITLERLETLLVDLANGQLEHKQILEEGGHGAYVRRAFGFQDAEVIVATGPKRSLAENPRLPIVLGEPFGNNMMTGTVGLLEAIRRCKGLTSICYP